MTTLEHLREDYARDMGEDDMTHVEEFVTLWDYKKYPIANSIAEHRERYRNIYEQRLVHHHVFDLNSALDLVNYSGWQVLAAEGSDQTTSSYFCRSLRRRRGMPALADFLAQT